MHRGAIIVALLVASLNAAPASALVLCLRRSGLLAAREQCKTRETLVDPVALGLQGPAGPPGGALSPCPPDSVKVGDLCADRYEASTWSIPEANASLIAKVRQGEATLQDLTDGGAIQLSGASFSLECEGPPIPMTFPANGNWSEPVYAVSIPGVLPAACVTWFQAAQACALSGKRLLTNEEWQRAASGTPDPGLTGDVCAILTPPALTGAHPDCVSSWGAYDMAGNVFEWIADWTELANGCTNWPIEYGEDVSCWGGASTTGGLPGAIARGGYFGFFGGVNAGIFSLFALDPPSTQIEGIGFRCGR